MSYGHKQTQETREKIRRRLLGHKRTAESVEKSAASHRGKIITLEQRKRISEAKKGWVPSEKTRSRMSASAKQRKQQPLTEQHRQNLSKAKKGWCPSKETRAKMSESRINGIESGSIVLPSWGKCGVFYSIKNKTNFHYRSTLELKWYQVFEHMDSVLRFSVESVSIPYFFNGGWHMYIPDIKLWKSDGTYEIIEIKPEVVFLRGGAKNEAKYTAARDWCAKRARPTVFRILGYIELRCKPLCA